MKPAGLVIAKMPRRSSDGSRGAFPERNARCREVQGVCRDFGAHLGKNLPAARILKIGLAFAFFSASRIAT